MLIYLLLFIIAFAALFIYLLSFTFAAVLFIVVLLFAINYNLFIYHIIALLCIYCTIIALHHY